jgi:ribosomal protein L24
MKVQVIKGKEKGKKGIVTKVLRDRNAVIVEGLNLVYSISNFLRGQATSRCERICSNLSG